jgi:anaerobic magnesium-protoporphyrin IX monomethyl ester cyclase
MAEERRVIQSDLRLWDYRHQVLATRLVPPWRVLLWLKATELAVQLRPRSLRRLAALPDPDARAVMRWYYGVGKRVWPHEVWNFLFCEKRRRDGPTLTEFWGPPLDAEEAAMRRVMAAG